MPQFPHVKWWNGISEKLGKAQRKTLLKRKVLQPGSMICPHAPWKNTALQLQRKALLSHVTGNIPKQLRPQPSYCSYRSHGLWISSSPFKIPNPGSLFLDNRPGQHICAHFCLISRSCLYCSPWLHPGYAGERTWEKEKGGQRLQESWREFEGDLGLVQWLPIVDQSPKRHDDP